MQTIKSIDFILFECDRSQHSEVVMSWPLVPDGQKSNSGSMTYKL